MGKKSKDTGNLGRSLIRERFHANRGRKHVSDQSMLHTTEIKDGYDWGRLNLQSVTEESSFQEFLSTAELAGTEFQAEKLNITFVHPKSNVGLLTTSEKLKHIEEQDKNKELLKIPRRPQWTPETTPEQLHSLERENFLDWRRNLAILQENNNIVLTPYEKNLEFWRQLWRVVERSDVVVQIVDARNPLLFRCEDLEKYVTEVSKHKLNLILINKADFLTEKQREIWADYFGKLNIRVAFFSASLAVSNTNEENLKDKVLCEEEESESSEEDENSVTLESMHELVQQLDDSVLSLEHRLNKTLSLLENCNLPVTDQKILSKLESSELEKASDISDSTQTLKDEILIENVSSKIESISNVIDSTITSTLTERSSPISLNSSEILTRDKLIEFFKNIHEGQKVQPGLTTIGLVGYPNVGKSSTINALMSVKKVSVSATPGKTKHFQTLYLDDNLMLCDCPGLVMPSFVFTKAEMVINGILPIDWMRDHVPPVNLVASLIPRNVIEDKYGIMLPKPLEGEDENRPPFAEELLNAHGYNRGFMTANGQPDNPRSARVILKDFVNGRLLYAHAPPGIEQAVYHPFPEMKEQLTRRVLPPREQRAIKPNRTTTEDLDKVFFRNAVPGVHAKGVRGKAAGVPVQNDGNTSNVILVDKPWKTINKHENKKKREKLRRVYAHLDQH